MLALDLDHVILRNTHSQRIGLQQLSEPQTEVRRGTTVPVLP